MTFLSSNRQRNDARRTMCRAGLRDKNKKIQDYGRNKSERRWLNFYRKYSCWGRVHYEFVSKSFSNRAAMNRYIRKYSHTFYHGDYVISETKLTPPESPHSQWLQQLG